MKYIGYYRVSTKEQGVSGLGLESQRNAVNNYIRSIGGELLNEYTEVESGKKKDRAILKAAIQQAYIDKAILVVKKLDRLSRAGLSILLELEEKGVKFIESDSPHDNDLIREIKLAMARDEAKVISNRTKAALGVIKNKIAEGEYISKAGNVVTGLGNPSNLTMKAVQKSVKSRREAALNNPANTRAYAFIKALKEAGKSYYFIKNSLNSAGFRTSKGNEFSEVQVKKLYEMFNQNLK